MPLERGTRLGPYEIEGITFSNYDVTRDGQFIMVKDQPGAARLNVVLNWFSELSRLAPAGVR